MRHHQFLISLVLGCCLAMLGCAADPEGKSESATSLLEPCELITKSDAETIIGEPVKPAEKSEQQVVGMKLCMYNPQDENSTAFLQIALTQQAFMNPDGVPPSDIFHSIKKAHREDRIDVTGIGEEAFIADGGLYILINGDYISIGAGNTDHPGIRERLKKAGETAINNLVILRQQES